MPRRKSTPSKRQLAPPDSVFKRPKRGKQRHAFQRQRTEPVYLSNVATAGGWSEEDALRVEIPVDSSLSPALTAVCIGNDIESVAQLQIDLTLLENDQAKLEVKGREDAEAHPLLSLADLFPCTYEPWKSHFITLAERGLLSLHINAKCEAEKDQWRFSFAVSVAWRKYMENYFSSSLGPMVAAPRANPMRSMHRVMTWLLKKIHDVECRLAEANAACRFRYWKEVEVLYDRFVGDNTAACAQFEDQGFAMPEIYARIDATKQLDHDISEYEAIEATLADLLPTLRRYQKAAVSWMLSREKSPTQSDNSLPLCVTFREDIAKDLQAYDPLCAAFYAAPPGVPWTQQEQLRPSGMDFSRVHGGILADEMGLGKTVEVIALTLSHRTSSSVPRLLSTHSSQHHLAASGDEEDSDVVACICGSSGDHPMGLVQCGFCGTWHHQLCTGYKVEESESALDYTTSSNTLWDFESDRAGNGATTTWSRGGFMCYHCQSHERPTFSCRTTLIVSPEPIHAQWEHEVSRHVRAGALSVMRYPGVRALKTRLEGGGPSAEWQVLASPGLVLARYDVVLTTYEALGADLRYVPTTEGKDRRSSTRSQLKRYAFVGSPLVTLYFWRVCMDEAQVGVENTRLQAALTLSRLSAENRWVVTGTPFSSRVSELFGYLRFLRVPPYTSSQVEDYRLSQNLQLLQAEHNEREGLDSGFFREAIEHNFTRGAVDRVLDLLLWNGCSEDDVVCGGGILWRTGKKHVVDQLGLPPQTSEVVWCRFTAVERHFYDQQEKRVVSLIQQRQQQQQQQQSVQTSHIIDRDDLLWQDLLVLRQLCCHPQVGGARQVWGSSGNTTSRAVMTMDAFLQELVNKATRECEEDQRQLIGAQNGLAALLVLEDKVSEAALKYLAVMKLIRTNWPQFRADLLPRLHILQNLEKCVCQLYSLRESGVDDESESLSDMGSAVDPKKVCLLPELPSLQKRVSFTGLLPDSDDLSDEEHKDISRECALLGQSARQIRQYYLLQADMKHTRALTNFRAAFQMIDDSQQHSTRAKTELLCSSGNWWSDALAIIEQSEQGSGAQLVDRVQARLSGFDTRWGTTFCSQLVSARSLRLLLVRELEVLAIRRRDLFKRLTALSEDTPTDSDVELSGNCKKCRDGGTGPVCIHCQLYKELDAYRRHFLGVDKTSFINTRIVDLFDDDMVDEDTANDSSGGLSTSLFMEIFKEISSCARSALRGQEDGRGLALVIQTGMQTETDFWLNLQREWQAGKKLFQAQHQRLGALDELVMACSQLRLRHPDEPPGRTKAERLYKLERVEVPVRVAELEAERVAADLALKDKLAQLRYLLQLRSESSTRQAHDLEASAESSSVRPVCAVCLQELPQRRAVLPCAHVFCTRCVSDLKGDRQHARKNIRCPTCRRVCAIENVTIVVERLASESTSINLEDFSQGEAISEVPSHPSPLHCDGGSLGSKLDALLERVEMLRQENPSVKCLLFSQWSQMLELVMQPLRRVGVYCFMYGTKRQLPKLLAQFQACPAACVLALPFKVGANGLNIVEATEVLLIEPLLSSSIEAQAVNRVHRLGQTRQTRVHRFIVQGSVEERIFRLGHKLKDHGAEDDQESKEEINDEDEGLQRLGVAPGRKEQEKLTMQDLQELLRGNADDSVPSSAATAVFWEELVMLNGNCVTRSAAFEFLERRHATQVRVESEGRIRGPQTKLFDKLMDLLIAGELLGLSYADDSNNVDVFKRIGPDLLHNQQAQIEEQVRVWRNAQGDNAM
ncbi:RING-type zinc-finger [Phytophthora infestans]|uniref:RING-type zinc-finger n=1 Tax=Phytophthora infestans TaxID=4787 RepID=A0A833S1J8_PHYIN|nr:RING-type zinc-finger [Phytophthora infestans]KAF4129919.1 RING-type zinc-finger [Phytophthora infestans]